jgi:hypothetical protein
MTLEMILTIVFGIIAVVVTFVGYWFSIKSKIQSAAEDAINMAEELDKMGEEKLQMAVDQVYAIIPAIVKPFLSREVITGLV